MINSSKEISNSLQSNRIIQYVIVAILFFAIGPSVFSSSWISSSDFHATIEMSSSLIAIIAGITSIVYFTTMHNTFFLIVGLGFFLCGSEDLIHGFLGFKRVWADSGVDFTHFIPGTYVTGRLLLGLFIIGAVFNERIIDNENFRRKIIRIVIPASLLFGGVITYIAFLTPLPQFVFPEQLISRPVDFISAIVFLTAGVLVFNRYKVTNDAFSHFLILCLILNFGGQIYMSFSKQLFDIFFDVAHVANILSYTMPVFGLTAFMIERQHALKQAEEEINFANKQLIANQQELEESNKELQQFAYVASHDLKEPLRMVSSYTQLLERRYADKLDDKAKKFIDYAVDGANRMQTLIDDLLRFSRISTQGDEFVKTDVNRLLQDVKKSMKTLIAERKAVITNDKLPEVVADKTQLERLFANLINNAVKYCNKKPEIHISAQKTKNEWLFSVQDNGIGIDKEFREKVFIIFQRLHTKDKYSGTGIGLAISKRIINRHDGRIWFESEPGKGTTFYFTLPVNINELHIN